jgi:hypothetical protein
MMSWTLFARTEDMGPWSDVTSDRGGCARTGVGSRQRGASAEMSRAYV